MEGTFDVWKLVAGLGIFLYGIFQLEDSVKALSGKAFRRLIRLYTDGKMRAIGSGTIVTAILQSSSAVSLMVLAFVGAGVMTMENAIGVIMGSNIGSTFTAWIIAALGFKLKIESFALPLVGVGGIGLVFFDKSSKPFHLCRLLIGFGFMFLGLDYMKGSVENFAKGFDLSIVHDYGLWVYLLVGILITALMQASSASIVIVLTALNSQLITFEMGLAMVIGANVGTTITVLLGSMGGTQSKKRVGFSHLTFNIITGLIAFIFLPAFVWFVKLFFDIENNSVMGLALFHTTFNIIGVVLFYPFVGVLARRLIILFPDHKAILTVYINNTPTEVPEAATTAIRNEIKHLLQECQLYNLRLLNIDEKLVFDLKTPFEANKKRKFNPDDLYENIKLLHAEIFSFYARLQNQQLEENEVKELERIIFASRNIMNSIKNFKGIRHNFDEFDSSENIYLNAQYKSFRKRILELYHDMNRILLMENKEEQYRRLLTRYVLIEEDDKRFIKATMAAVYEKKIQEMEISSLLLVNRLFTQTCRLQIFSLKDLLLTSNQVNDFDRAMDMKEIIEEEKAKVKEDTA
ncbi:MAG: Na/Pi cotransporter family protein [Proteobacteria bacterium]|nr:Na/Pi cotransporter family protein [Pseudomonadota bacterium]MBU1710427.1 Na/Pi cotransporter family protein [Pseudomonadota bacterium]